MATTPKTPKTGGGTPPVTPDVDKFKDGTILRSGQKTTDSKFTNYKADVLEGQTIQSPDIEVPAKSAAIFDEEGLDPYEVYEANRASKIA